MRFMKLYKMSNVEPAVLLNVPGVAPGQGPVATHSRGVKLLQIITPYVCSHADPHAEHAMKHLCRAA